MKRFVRFHYLTPLKVECHRRSLLVASASIDTFSLQTTTPSARCSLSRETATHPIFSSLGKLCTPAPPQGNSVSVSSGEGTDEFCGSVPKCSLQAVSISRKSVAPSATGPVLVTDEVCIRGPWCTQTPMHWSPRTCATVPRTGGLPGGLLLIFLN